MLNPRVEVFHVLAHDNEVNAAARVGGTYARELAHGPHIGIGLEELAERHVGALLSVADRSAEGALQDAAGLVYRLDGIRRHSRGDALLEDTLTGVTLLPRDRGARRLDDSDGRFNALWTDAVARNNGNKLLAVRRDVSGHGCLQDAGIAGRSALRRGRPIIPVRNPRSACSGLAETPGSSAASTTT